MADIQTDINKLIEEKEKQDLENKALADKIVNETVQNNNALIEETKKQQMINDLFKDDEFTEEEKAYYDSPLLKNYIEIIKNLDIPVQNACTALRQEYQKNNLYYNDPFYKEVSNGMLISGIGFPIPEKFLNKLGTIIDNKMNENLGIENAECDIKITTCEYIEQNNTFKKIDSYQVVATAKQKIKENIRK